MEYKLLEKLFYIDENEFKKVYKERFESENTVRLNFYIHKYECFVYCNIEVMNLLYSIMKKDKEILKLQESLPSAALNKYIDTCLVEEMKITNDIESVNSTRKELSELLKNSEDNRQKRFVGLVNKYYMLRNKEKINLKSCHDIREIYDDLLKNELEEDKIPDGMIFRKESVEVVSGHKVLHTGVSPETQIIDDMNRALSILEDTSINYLIRIAVFHYLFAYIHPFYDGNGRTARFMSSYCLSKELELLSSIRIAYSMKKNQKLYYKGFDDCNDIRSRGDLTSFVILFLGFLLDGMTSVEDELKENSLKFNFYADILTKGKFKETYKSVLLLILQSTLYEADGMGISDLISDLTWSKTKVRGVLKELEGFALVTRIKQGREIKYQMNFDAFNGSDND